MGSHSRLGQGSGMTLSRRSTGVCLALFRFRLVFASEPQETKGRVILGASTVAIVAIAAVVIDALIVLMYVVPRGGRRRRPKL